MPPTAEPTLATTSPADLALVRAIRAWGDRGDDDEDGGNPFGWLARFSPAYRERILDIWLTIARVTPELAWQTLLRDHRAAARFDPARVHPSWLVRILAAESPAVRALVMNRASGPVRAALRHGPARLAPVRPVAPFADPAAADWALALWTERLVGDVPESPSDPPVILALSQFSLRDLVRLARALGQIKLAFALDGQAPGPLDDATARTNPTERVRIGFFRRTIGRPDARLVPLARADFDSVPADRRRKFAAVGLISVARLLKGCDAHRARWAVQHLPYSIAKRLGELGASDRPGTTGLPLRAIRAWEAWNFEAAWGRLLSEGRIGPGRRSAS